MVDILLAAYNGERYIEEQIVSIQKQTVTNWRLIIRDDESSDNTIKIIREIQQKDPRIILLSDKKGNLGVVRNFEELLWYSEGDYIMFADQDDVWLPNKINDSFNLMKEVEYENPDKPILIHTDVTVVDSFLNVVDTSFIEKMRYDVSVTASPKMLAIANCIMGCTVMINSISKRYILPFNNYVIMHDWWIGLIVAYYGKIVYLNKATSLYRQHFNNQIGANTINGNYYLRKVIGLTGYIKLNYQYSRMISSLPFRMNISNLLYLKMLHSIKIFFQSLKR